jgi:hypothetical protein
MANLGELEMRNIGHFVGRDDAIDDRPARPREKGWSGAACAMRI